MTSYDPDNIFAKILAGEFPAVKLFENEDCIAIMDVFPQSPGHCLVLPRAASRNLIDANTISLQNTIVHVQSLAKAVKIALDADGIRIAQFNETAAGQTVFHLHWHVIPAYDGQKLKEHTDKITSQGEMAAHVELESLAEKIRAKL